MMMMMVVVVVMMQTNTLRHDAVCLVKVFSSSRLFPRRWSGWNRFTGQLPGMCHLYTGGSGCAGRQAQSPSHCSLGAGGDLAGGGCGEGALGEHIAGEGFVSVWNGARDAVKFQQAGRVSCHRCVVDLG